MSKAIPAMFTSEHKKMDVHVNLNQQINSLLAGILPGVMVSATTNSGATHINLVSEAGRA